MAERLAGNVNDWGLRPLGTRHNSSPVVDQLEAQFFQVFPATRRGSFSISSLPEFVTLPVRHIDQVIGWDSAGTSS